jgi:hypothetical protein
MIIISLSEGTGQLHLKNELSALIVETRLFDVEQLTGPTMSETCETEVPEAAPR